jgi:type IX secretion system PorP/SprF family membrane protein
MNIRNRIKSIVVVCFVCSFAVSKAQQDPYFSHFKSIKQSYNPAAAGERDEYYCVNALFHKQWLNYDDYTIVRGTDYKVQNKNDVIQDVAPTTYAFNFGTQIAWKGNRNSIGIGLAVTDDKVIFFKTTSVRLQAAYHFRMPSRGALLAVGPEIGITQFGYITPKFKSLDPNDPNIPFTGGSQIKPDAGIGVYYRQDRIGSSNFQKFYAGFSARHLNAPKYNLSLTMQNGQSATLNHTTALQYYLVSGVNDWYLNPVWSLEPAVLIKQVMINASSRPQFDLNVTALYSKTIRGGLGYRQWGNIDAITIMLGYIRKELQVGYSYDITLSRLREAGNNTHEVFVSYCFQPPTIKKTIEYKKNVRHN